MAALSGVTAFKTQASTLGKSGESRCREGPGYCFSSSNAILRESIMYRPFASRMVGMV